MKATSLRPWLPIVAGGESVISQAGGVLLAQTARGVGLDRGLSRALRRWRLPGAVHDPGKTVLDLALMLALGGDCMADVATLRSQPAAYGPVASDPTISRLIDRLADDESAALAALRSARAAARARAWTQAGAPLVRDKVVVDLDATLITAHSEKETAAKTWKKGFGFHPIGAWIDHGRTGTGEPVGWLLRRGSAGSNTTADHQAMLTQVLSQLPAGHRERDTAGWRPVLVRTDAAGATHGFAKTLHSEGLAFSLGAPVGTMPAVATLLDEMPAQAWTPAYNADGRPRTGAWVAEVTDAIDLSAWPEGTRLILRKERPHPGAQLRLIDADGLRITGFFTNVTGGQLAELETHHRSRARAEDRIRAAKDTGAANLPFHGRARNAIWLELVALAQDLTAWLQRLALDGEHARAEPKRLRLRIFSAAARLIRTGRRRILRLAGGWPWDQPILAAHQRLHALAPT